MHVFFICIVSICSIKTFVLYLRKQNKEMTTEIYYDGDLLIEKPEGCYYFEYTYSADILFAPETYTDDAYEMSRTEELSIESARYTSDDEEIDREMTEQEIEEYKTELINNAEIYGVQ